MLLRERPIECNVDPGFREIEEQEDAQLREEAWQTFLADLYSSQDERLDRIDELGLQAFDLTQDAALLFETELGAPPMARPAVTPERVVVAVEGALVAVQR